MGLVDIGVNLAHGSFDADREAVIRRARDAGVSAMIVTGSSRESSHGAAALAADFPGVLWSTAGVHPHHAQDYGPGDAGWIRALCGHPEVVAVGECGLDFFRNFSPPEDQERAFRAQLELAVELRMPVFLHQRDAHARFRDILADCLADLPAAVAHCFTGGREELEDYLALDLYIGLTGWICDERRGLHLREIVGLIPDDRLLLETDAPYLLPRDLDPRPATRRNEPAYLPHILAAVARYRDQDPASVARSTKTNARRFFGLTNTDNQDE